MTANSERVVVSSQRTGEERMIKNVLVFICSLLTVFLLTFSLVEPQQPKKVSRLGYLAAGNAAGESARADAIRLALRELGYIEGQNIAIEYRYAGGKRDRYPELAAELVHLKFDII